MDEAVQELRDRGIEVFGVVCHVSNAQQRKNLVDKTIQVSTCSIDQIQKFEFICMVYYLQDTNELFLWSIWYNSEVIRTVICIGINLISA